MPKTNRETLAAVFDHFMAAGLTLPDSASGAGAATNAYLVARRTGTIPLWAIRGSMAHAAARAGVRHHRAING
jgi:hypothetical protein